MKARKGIQGRQTEMDMAHLCGEGDPSAGTQACHVSDVLQGVSLSCRRQIAGLATQAFLGEDLLALTSRLLASIHLDLHLMFRWWEISVLIVSL